MTTDLLCLPILFPHKHTNDRNKQNRVEQSFGLGTQADAKEAQDDKITGGATLRVSPRPYVNQRAKPDCHVALLLAMTEINRIGWSSPLGLAYTMARCAASTGASRRKRGSQGLRSGRKRALSRALRKEKIKKAGRLCKRSAVCPYERSKISDEYVRFKSGTLPTE